MTEVGYNQWSGRRESLTTAALFLGILGVYSLTWFQGLGVSISTIGAERVLRGEIPYRDFWTMYAPGHFYLLALLFRIFGSHILVETIAASVVCAGAGVFFYWLVVNLTHRRLAAFLCAAIFVASTYNTGYFKSLGSYPPAILFILIALTLMVLHYNTGRLGYLMAAGLATGAAVSFKHDVGGYTVIAVLAGLLAHPFMFWEVAENQSRQIMLKVAFYGAGFALIVLPVYIYFFVVAGKDLWQDLVIFPLTDFRFARPEHYPGLFEFNIPDESFLKALAEIFRYLSFTLPFALFLCGLTAIVLAARAGKRVHAVIGLTGSVAYLLHYSAAHVQINTHIISMSIYGACLGVIFFDLLEREFGLWRTALAKFLGLALAGTWFLSLAAMPADETWNSWRRLTTELKFAKVSGVKVPPELVANYAQLRAFVDSQVSPEENLFVGLHRHDVVVVGANAADYFILDRPIATRYHELHPAIVDTADVQREIIRDLQEKKVSLIILKRIKTDDRLEMVKRDFLRNLPQIGATDLDRFIRANYVQVKEIRGNTIWKRKDADSQRANSKEHKAES